MRLSCIFSVWFLLFSFLYGIIHAIGPGNGKSLISSNNHNDSCGSCKTHSTDIGVILLIVKICMFVW